MKENAILQFFKKIHLSVVDARYLASQSLNATTKSVFWFFISFFFISLAISSISRTERITKLAPEAMVSTFGILKFENNSLISPDTLKYVDGWRLKELGALVSGIKIPQSVVYPVEITIGTDSIKTTQNSFIHIGKTAFYTNFLSSYFSKNEDDTQSVLWEKILPSQNLVVDADFYRSEFSKLSNRLNIFFAEVFIIGIEMTSAIMQIWIAILIYLLFFGRMFNFFGRIRLLMLTTVPYFILMPVSIAAANGVVWTTDIALIAGLVMTFRALTTIETPLNKENKNEKI